MTPVHQSSAVRPEPFDCAQDRRSVSEVEGRSDSARPQIGFGTGPLANPAGVEDDRLGDTPHVALHVPVIPKPAHRLFQGQLGRRLGQVQIPKGFGTIIVYHVLGRSDTVERDARGAMRRVISNATC